MLNHKGKLFQKQQVQTQTKSVQTSQQVKPDSWNEYNPLKVIKKKEDVIKIKKKKITEPAPKLLKKKSIEQKQVLKQQATTKKAIPSVMDDLKPIPTTMIKFQRQKDKDFINLLEPELERDKIFKKRSLVDSPSLIKPNLKIVETELDRILEEDDDKILLNEEPKGVEVYICKRLMLIYQEKKIPICLVSDIIPLLPFFQEDELKILNTFSSKDTIEFLGNSDRSLLYGQIQYDFNSKNSGDPKLLFSLSEHLLKEDKIFAFKYNQKNSCFCIVNRRQLQIILSKRRLPLNMQKTSLIVKQWMNDDYIKWWIENQEYQEHSLFYLIFYKQPPINVRPQFEKITILQPQNCVKLNQELVETRKSKFHENQITKSVSQTQKGEQDADLIRNILEMYNPFISQLLNPQGSQQNILSDATNPIRQHPTNIINIPAIPISSTPFDNILTNLNIQLDKDDYFSKYISFLYFSAGN